MSEDERPVKYLELALIPTGSQPIQIVETIEKFGLDAGFLTLYKWNPELDNYEPYRGYSLTVVERFEIHNEPPAIRPVQMDKDDGFESLQTGSASGGYYKLSPEEGLRAA